MVFTSCRNVACSNMFFLWLVDYAPEGSMFLLSKCDFSPLFQAERSLLQHNKAFRFFNFLLEGRKGERLNLDLPLVAGLEIKKIPRSPFGDQLEKYSRQM